MHKYVEINTLLNNQLKMKFKNILKTNKNGNNTRKIMRCCKSSAIRDIYSHKYLAERKKKWLK